MSDGELRSIFRSHLPRVFWQSIESWSTGQGVPDAHYLFAGGMAGWIENKKTSGWVVDIKREQGAWLDRYARLGGRCFVAVRRQAAAGPRRGKANDELWLFHGRDAQAVRGGGLNAALPLGKWENGPARWNWAEITILLTR